MVGASMSIFSDMIIAALPALQGALGASDQDAQQVVSLFFLATSVMALCVGALADAFGRRPVILCSLGVLVLTALSCAASERIEQLWLLRVIQGAAACVGIILSRTIVRDLVSGVQVPRFIGQISLIQALVPVATPIIGAWLATAYGWRTVFLGAATASFVMLASFARSLPETLPRERRQPFRPVALFEAYRTVLGSGVFLRLAVAHSLNWSGILLYAVAAPKIVVGLLGASPRDIYFLFAAVMLPMAAGFVLLPRALARYGPRGTLKRAYGVCWAAVALNIVLALAGVASFLALLPLALYAIGLAATTALLIGAALEPFPDNAGMASSCQMFLQYVVLGLAAGLLVPLVWGSLIHLALAQAGLTLAGFLLMLWQQRYAGRRTPAS
jgi:DHA1 family bicyclomycin/chloramphenicol resistance-like MFS transporter